MYQRILVAVNHETYHEAVSEALKLVEHPGVRIRIVHVIDVPVNASEGVNLEGIYRAREDEGRRLLDDAMALARAARVEPESALIDGMGRRIGELLREEVATWHADLLVMGAKRRSPLARIFSDNVCDAIVGRTPVAVLLGGVLAAQHAAAAAG
ncbi:MAG: universal stress protein [Dehalococcoidia bacterium]|nr:MAG: universal stress protein [Dehalococcoidia bacterium]